MEATVAVVPTKKWYYSKTLWMNGLAFAALLAQMSVGFIIAPDEQLAILAVLNLVLRMFTSQKLSS